MAVDIASAVAQSLTHSQIVKVRFPVGPIAARHSRGNGNVPVDACAHGATRFTSDAPALVAGSGSVVGAAPVKAVKMRVRACNRVEATMAQEDQPLTRINRTRFVVAANARCRVLMEQPFRDAVRLGVLPAPRLFAGAPRSRCHPHPVSRGAGRIESYVLLMGRCPSGRGRGRARPRLGDRPDRPHEHLNRLADEVEQAMKSGK
jgi:hypothetical protein